MPTPTSETGWGITENANQPIIEKAVQSVATFGTAGVLTTQVGVGRFLFPLSAKIVSAIMAVNTAPTGASIICDVNKNGTTIFTTQANRPAIAATSFASSAAVPDVTTFAIGDYLTVDIDQVGSTIAGADLVLQVLYVFA
jgi:hypothetical protein